MNKEEMQREIKKHQEMFEQLNTQAGYHMSQIVAYKKDIEELSKPKVTGRPFMDGVYEPYEGQEVWAYIESREEPRKLDFCSYNSGMDYMLRHGELYPTKADCELGDKRREVQARYRAMGDGFKPNDSNWYAYYSHGLKKVALGKYKNNQHREVYFRRMEACRSAIDTINRLYGEHAFERYVLEVEP